MDILTIVALIIAFLSMASSVYMAFVKRKTFLKSEAKERENEELKKQQAINEEKMRSIQEIKDAVEIELGQALEEILDQRTNGFVTKQEAKDRHETLVNDIKDITEKVVERLDTVIETFDKSETKYIRYVVVQFADDIRNGTHRSNVSYRNILEYYDYYKNHLHQNSYIDQEILYIKSQMEKKKKEEN